MFEIGSTLREARTRRGLELRDAQEATRIRAKYLAALEEERFDELPAEAYARAFLRTYADFLGLDGARCVAEFGSRLEASRPVPPSQPERRFRFPSVDSRVAAVLGVAAAIAAAGVLAWRLGGGPEARTVPAGPLRPPPAATVPTTASAPPARPRREGTPLLARLVLTAARGDCWLSVRAGSRDGRVLYEGTLREGDSLRFSRKRVWIRMGAPWNLESRLNGRTVRALPANTGNVVVTRAGLRPA